MHGTLCKENSWYIALQHRILGAPTNHGAAGGESSVLHWWHPGHHQDTLTHCPSSIRKAILQPGRKWYASHKETPHNVNNVRTCFYLRLDNEEFFSRRSRTYSRYVGGRSRRRGRRNPLWHWTKTSRKKWFRCWTIVGDFVFRRPSIFKIHSSPPSHLVLATQSTFQSTL